MTGWHSDSTILLVVYETRPPHAAHGQVSTISAFRKIPQRMLLNTATATTAATALQRRLNYSRLIKLARTLTWTSLALNLGICPRHPVVEHTSTEDQNQIIYDMTNCDHMPYSLVG